MPDSADCDGATMTSASVVMTLASVSDATASKYDGGWPQASSDAGQSSVDGDDVDEGEADDEVDSCDGGSLTTSSYDGGGSIVVT